jgi:hypothetical protein
LFIERLLKQQSKEALDKIWTNVRQNLCMSDGMTVKDFVERLFTKVLGTKVSTWVSLSQELDIFGWKEVIPSSLANFKTHLFDTVKMSRKVS